MTVRRNERRTFDVEKERLAGIVREVLQEDRAYRRTEEQEDYTFTTVFKPNFMFGDTGMKISLYSDGHSYGRGTTVDVTTVSPKFAYGDAFNGYGKIVQDFFSNLEQRIENPEVPLGKRKLTETWHGRTTLGALVAMVACLTILPAILWLFEFRGLAISLFFYPIGAALGFVLAYSIYRLHSRFGLLLAAPVAVVGFVVAFALLIAVDFMVSGLLSLDESSGSMSSGGLMIGVMIMAFTRLKPEGFEGEVSEERDLRGGRGALLGMKRSARHWLLGEPHFPGNLAMLILHLLVGLLSVAFAVFALVNGSTSPLIFAFLLMGIGILLYGLAETISLGPRWATVAGRTIALLGCPVFLVLVLFGL